MVDHVQSGLQGLGGISSGVTQGLYSVSTVQKGPIGALLEDEAGRRFRYSYFTGAVGPGKLAAQDISATGFAIVASKTVNSAGTAADTAAGAKTIYILDSTSVGSVAGQVPADTYAGGYMYACNLGGEGHTYRIKGNTATSAAFQVQIDLYDGLVIGIDSESSIGVTGSRWNNLKVANDATDAILGGLTLVDVAAGEYAWVQTKGECCALYESTADAAVIGSIAQLAFATDGAVQALGAGALDSEDVDFGGAVKAPIVGYFLQIAAADGDYAPIMLTLE